MDWIMDCSAYVNNEARYFMYNLPAAWRAEDRAGNPDRGGRGEEEEHDWGGHLLHA